MITERYVGNTLEPFAYPGTQLVRDEEYTTNSTGFISISLLRANHKASLKTQGGDGQGESAGRLRLTLEVTWP